MGDDGGCGDETSDQQLHKAQAVRRGAEHVAKQLLVRLDRCYTVVSDNTAASHTTNTSQTTSPWEELSLTSRTNRCVLYASPYWHEPDMQFRFACTCTSTCRISLNELSQGSPLPKKQIFAQNIANRA